MRSPGKRGDSKRTEVDRLEAYPTTSSAGLLRGAQAIATDGDSIPPHGCASGYALNDRARCLVPKPWNDRRRASDELL
jgi:hypothetical protein